MSRSERSQTAVSALIELRSLVLNGAFGQGDRLPETTVAERLLLSHTPLRQAMDRRVDEGLLERIDTGGCRVAKFSLQDIIDAIELRGVLEGTTARLDAERGTTDANAGRMEKILSEPDRAKVPDTFDFRTYVGQNAAFHTLQAELAGSQIIARELARAYHLPAASPAACMQGQELIPDFRDSQQRAQCQRRAIFKAISAREGSRADALTREHARVARINLKYVMNERPQPGRACARPVVGAGEKPWEERECRASVTR